MTDEFSVDLTMDEMRRRAHVMEAADDLDPVQMLADEAEAYRMLYSNLDEHQQKTYEMLVESGILPVQE